jgi:hypothetical protein
MILDSLVKQVAVLEKLIKDLQFAMRHVHPASVDALRKQKEELEAIYDELMESCVLSNFDLEYMLSAHGECLRDCFRPTYTGRPIVLPKPQWPTPPPPPPPTPPAPTVPGVNLILYIDATGSMRDDLGLNGNLRKELVQFANYLKTESTRANIPCTVSLVWFGDATEGDGRNTYYTISMNKGTVETFSAKISYPRWYNGGAGIAESGILAMKETLTQVVKSGVANTLIYVTDAPSKANEFGATPDQVKKMFADNGIKAYAIIPFKAPDIKGMFLDVRDFTKAPYNIIPWADKTLRP